MDTIIPRTQLKPTKRLPIFFIKNLRIINLENLAKFEYFCQYFGKKLKFFNKFFWVS